MTATIIWLLIILVVSVIPSKGLESNLPLDKVVHFIIYGIAVVFLLKVFRVSMPLRKAFWLSVLSASAYGLVIEFIQSFLPWRSFSLGDGMANFAGALVFGIVYTIREQRQDR